jgi:acyl-CoA thioesterase-1
MVTIERRWAVLWVIALAAGCSRDRPPNASDVSRSSGPGPAAPAGKPALEDTRPKLVAFGDSLTSGVGENGDYPSFLQKELDRSGYHWRVVNEGVAGETTTDGLARVSSIVALKPKVVVLEFGGNDGLRGVPVAATRQNLAAMIETLQKAGITVLLAGITLPPNYGAEYIRPFEQMYRDLAKQYRVAFLPFLLQDVALVEGRMSADGIHPTRTGNEQVARNVYRAVVPLLGRD